MMKPPMAEEDEDMSALSGLMAKDAPAPEAETDEQGAGKDPELLVSELKAKLAELEAVLG